MSETVARWLEAAGAQRDLVQWAEAYGSDWQALWRACPRGDWLLAIAARRGTAREAILRAARAVATLALDHAEGEERAMLEAALAVPSADAADVVEARAARSVDPAHQAALAAVAIAVRGAVQDQPAVAMLVAQAAAMDAADCAMGAAVSYAQRRGAELVREAIPDAP